MCVILNDKLISRSRWRTIKSYVQRVPLPWISGGDWVVEVLRHSVSIPRCSHQGKQTWKSMSRETFYIVASHRLKHAGGSYHLCISFMMPTYSLQAKSCSRELLQYGKIYRSVVDQLNVCLKTRCSESICPLHVYVWIKWALTSNNEDNPSSQCHFVLLLWLICHAGCALHAHYLHQDRNSAQQDGRQHQPSSGLHHRWSQKHNTGSLGRVGFSKVYGFLT